MSISLLKLKVHCRSLAIASRRVKYIYLCYLGIFYNKPLTFRVTPREEIFVGNGGDSDETVKTMIDGAVPC